MATKTEASLLPHITHCKRTTLTPTCATSRSGLRGTFLEGTISLKCPAAMAPAKCHPLSTPLLARFPECQESLHSPPLSNLETALAAHSSHPSQNTEALSASQKPRACRESGKALSIQVPGPGSILVSLNTHKPPDSQAFLYKTVGLNSEPSFLPSSEGYWAHSPASLL